jgi:hypothetical protein
MTETTKWNQHEEKKKIQGGEKKMKNKTQERKED